MPSLARRIALVLLCLLATATWAGESKMHFPEEQIPRLNVPHMATAPTIDGTIDGNEWRNAVKVMGVVSTHSLSYKDRPISFWLAWDATHLYLATRSDILPGHRLYRSKRDRFTTAVVYDDSFEFGVFLHDRNKLEGEHSSYLKFILNSLGSGEYMKIYPSIGQNMYNWQPEMQIANRLYEQDDRRWWDMEVAMDLQDLQLSSAHKAGDKIDMLLAADLKNPEWQWLDFPSASGHLEHYGFPRLVLTNDQPYIQIERIAGLHDEKLDLKAAIYNPSPAPVTVNAVVAVNYAPPPSRKEPVKAVVDEQRTLTIPARGAVRVDLEKAFPGLAYEFTQWGAPTNQSSLRFAVTRADAPAAAPVYHYACSFSGTNKNYLKATPRTTVFDYDMQFNPVSNRLFLAGDTLDAQIPAGAKPAALTYAITREGATVKEGRIVQYVNFKYEDLVEMPALPSGKYQVALALVDAQGKALVSRNDISFLKKDEAKEFAAWWGKKFGDPEKVLQPFTPLTVKGTTVACTRREYQLDGLGLPRQIIANGGKVLTRPARIVVTVGGKAHSVPTTGKLTFTRKQGWRVEFTGASAVAGVAFTVTGWMEQDGLVNLALTYAPQRTPVAIEGLRVEWPVDDQLGSWMSCIGGTGGNYSARTIGKVPDGQGPVWNTLKDIGKAGSTMIIGNWQSNLWVGNEQRGLLWCADSDRGWVPNDATPAHSLVRTGAEVAIWNSLIHLAPGEKAYLLEAQRTVQLQYNATPFRHFAPGWRLTQVSAANGFSRPDYKTNEKTKQEYFSILSMPSTDVKEWPDYYARYQAKAAAAAKPGWYSIGPRLTWFLTNQIALRGYMDKSTEPGLYSYFSADWWPGNESLNPSYQDYMMYLMDRHIREGGVTHYYYDISFSRSERNLIAGLGYRLPDGRVQPTSMDAMLREWYRRSWALSLENGLYPGGVSGHATNSICLRALPWTDAILDSEYPMKDPIAVYPSDRMIAMSCPHTFGVNISHLGFMHPDWAALHDSAQGGSGFPFNSTPFRHFGITAGDVQFLPYWRNQQVVKPAEPGVLASIWTRPGAAVVQVLNYGPDPDGQETTRSARLTLNLRALGVPAGAKPGQVRIREMLPNGGRIAGHSKLFAWYGQLPDASRWKNDEQPKIRPAAAPTLDVATGVLDGVELYYHDSRYLLVTWDEKAVPAEKWTGIFTGKQLADVLEWGINRPAVKALTAAEVTASVQAPAGVHVQVWRQPGTVLLRVANPSTKATDATLTLDLDRLGVKVKRLWTGYTQCVGGTLDAETGAVTVKGIKPGAAAVVTIDTF
jgi:hypothetical protein